MSLSTILHTAGTELSRISKTAETEPCRFSKLAFGSSCQSVNSGNCCPIKFTEDMDHRSLPQTITMPESVMPPDGDAAIMSPHRCIAMPSPAWSRRSRRRDLVTLDQDKKSAEVTLGPIVHKKFEVPLDH